MQEPTGKKELKEEARIAKIEDEQQNKNKEKNPKNELLNSLFDPKAKDDCDVAMYTGCTASVCVIDEKTAYFANSGDSRAIIAKNGVAYPMTNDHKPELDEEKNRIYKADGWVSEGRVKGIY